MKRIKLSEIPRPSGDQSPEISQHGPKNISSLPEEVLRHIFQFLNIHQRLVAAPVCKKWLKVLNCHHFLCDIEIKYKNAVEESIKLSYHMTRNFEYFSFSKINISVSIVKFLQKYAKQFVTLSFVDCLVNFDKYEDTLHGETLKCDNLKTLCVRDCDIIPLFSSLPNLKSLDLFSECNLTDFMVCHLNNCLIKLEELTLSSEISCNDELDKGSYMNEETIETNPSSSVLSFASIKLLLENNRNTLRDIYFSNLKLSPAAVQNISEIKGLKLRRFVFPFGLELEEISKFCKNQVSLTCLDLSCRNGTISAICNCLPNLQELTVTDNTVIDKCIIEIYQLVQLEILDLSDCDNISELSYHEAISNLKTFKLKHLNLSNSNISDENLFELLKHNPNLRLLDISGTSVSNKTLNMICKHLLLLKWLMICSCTKISDVGLTGEFEPDSDTFTPTPLSNLKNLRILDLTLNSSITNNACLKAIRFSSLQYLVLTESDSMVLDSDFKNQLKKQNPYLQIHTEWPDDLFM